MLIIGLYFYKYSPEILEIEKKEAINFLRKFLAKYTTVFYFKNNQYINDVDRFLGNCFFYNEAIINQRFRRNQMCVIKTKPRKAFRRNAMSKKLICQTLTHKFIYNLYL